eukprot:3707215-Alexandrium_andersonii.AAC.1
MQVRDRPSACQQVSHVLVVLLLLRAAAPYPLVLLATLGSAATLAADLDPVARVVGLALDDALAVGGLL